MKLKSYPCVYGLNVFLVLKFLCGNPNFYYDGWRRKWQPLQYSCLENPVDRGAWWAAVHRVVQSWTRLKRLSMRASIGEGNGNAFRYSCLENPRDGGAWWAAVYGVAQSRTRLKRLSSSSSSSSSSRVCVPLTSAHNAKLFSKALREFLVACFLC